MRLDIILIVLFFVLAFALVFVGAKASGDLEVMIKESLTFNDCYENCRGYNVFRIRLSEKSCSYQCINEYDYRDKIIKYTKQSMED